MSFLPWFSNLNLTPRKKNTLLCALVLLCGLWGTWPMMVKMPGYHGQDLRSFDADTHYFVQAWDETPRFVDTLRWWYGPWGQKYRPFYRPIPSTLFWTQYQLFGVNGKFQFHVLLLLWHFVALLVIWRFLVDLLGKGVGTFATCLWCANVAHYLSMIGPGEALWAWKDTVESWHALAHTACLWAFLRFLKTEDRRWQIAAFFLFWLALCVKELSYMAPFLMLLLTWYQGRLRTHWRTVLPFFALAGAMFVFRYWALGFHMGFRMGSNNSWKVRLVNENFGGAFTRGINGDCLLLSIVVLALGCWHLYHRRLKWGVAGLVSAVALLFYTAYCSGLSVEDTASRLLVESEWIEFPLLCLILFFWRRFFKNQNRHQILGVLLALIVYAPLTSGPNTAHIFYFVSIGWSIWLAYALLDAGALIQNGAPRCLSLKNFRLLKGTS